MINNSDFRVLQLIDSLQPGGAERVAVNVANALVSHVDKSYLCATRCEGLLREQVSKEVNYLFLNKRSVLDIRAFLKLRTFLKLEKINVIHAHSSSFFLATLMKFFNRKLKIVWHDHYGNSDFLENRKKKVLRFCSQYFNQIFCVNKNLEFWAKQNLKSKNIAYLPNFAVKNRLEAVTNLKGIPNKRIVCLANLRAQKDHFTLLEAFKKVLGKYQDWTLHLVGKDFYDIYSKRIKALIASEKLNENVFFYGSKFDVSNILSQATIGVLSSKSEGLPLALLEYGLAELPVVATNVGECASLLKDGENGLLVSPENSNELSKALELLIENKKKRKDLAIHLNLEVKTEYSEKEKRKTLIATYKNCFLK